MVALIAAITALILLLPGCGGRAKATAAADPETLVAAGDEAPDFTVTTFDGETLRLSDLRGEVVLLNFWATWCPPCREELKRVQSELIDRFAGRGFRFLPISRGEERQIVADFRAKTGHAFAMGLDPDRTIYDLYATNYIPRNYLIDRRGRVVLATVGYEPEEFDALILAVENELDNK